MSKIIAIDKKVGGIIDDDEELGTIRAQTYSNTVKQSKRSTHYYCGFNVKKFISQSYEALGLDMGHVAQFLWINGLIDYDLDPIVKNSFVKIYLKFMGHFEERLGKYKKLANDFNIDISDILTDDN